MLNKKITIYVPSTLGEESRPDLLKVWKRMCIVGFSEMFGGATAMEAEGGYITDDKNLVVENVVLVYAFTDAEGLAKHMDAVKALALRIAKAMNQECVAVECDGVMEFVEPVAEAA